MNTVYIVFNQLNQVVVVFNDRIHFEESMKMTFGNECQVVAKTELFDTMVTPNGDIFTIGKYKVYDKPVTMDISKR